MPILRPMPNRVAPARLAKIRRVQNSLLRSRYSLIVSCILFTLFYACQPKTAPVITERKAPPPRKIENIYPPRETIAPDTTAGKKIFAMRCDRCHGLPLATQFSRQQWDAILPVMFPRAGLNNEEALHVRSWLLANSAPARQ